MMTLNHHLHKSRYHNKHVYTLHKNICQDIWEKLIKIGQLTVENKPLTMLRSN